jgi:hypothetical protein
MQNDTIETYETPELCDLGKAEELTKGLPEGAWFDLRGLYRIQIGVLPTDAE